MRALYHLRSIYLLRISKADDAGESGGAMPWLVVKMVCCVGNMISKTDILK
jgi:hypothetical protein